MRAVEQPAEEPSVMQEAKPLRPDLLGDEWYKFSLDQWLYRKLCDLMFQFQKFTLIQGDEIV
jgi:hypothetical protein